MAVVKNVSRTEATSPHSPRPRKEAPVNPTPDPDAPETGDPAVPNSRAAGPLSAHPSRADALTVGPVSTGSLSAGPETVPRQMRADRTPDGHPAPGLFEDPVDAPDPSAAAEAAAVENLLRCWVREKNLSAPTGRTLRIPLNASGIALLVPVLYWSVTGWHRFGKPVIEGGSIGAPRADAVTVAALLGREAGQSDSTELVGRVADSVNRTAVFITERRRSPEPSSEADPFLTAEQSLLLGHPLHPTPKSREGLSDAEFSLYSPELHGSFALHWMAVDRSVLAQDSAWTEGGRTLPAARLTARLSGGVQHPDNTALLPLHPWQARDLAHRPAVASLLDAGLLHDLGRHGDRWYPTSSVRTVHRPGGEAMLKLSLRVRITNSRRENLRKELHRGVEVHRVLRSGLGGEWQAAHPGFDIIRDPAWLAVNTPEGEPLPGFDVVLRHNPFGVNDDAVCVAGLTAVHPRPGAAAMRSRLADIVTALAARTGRSTGAVATEWFLRYLDHVVRPVLWLDGTAGIALEAHQQNTIVILGPGGWPVGGRYRDNQGYYFRESHRTALEKRLPGIGAVSDTFVADDVTDERFAYYLAINNVFGLIGAFGSQQLADERLLIAAFRQFLARATALGSPLPAQLLDTPVLRTKANLLTRLHGLDELVGPVDTQSVYVRLSNPLHPTGA
ncbi:iron transporter [Streptomyces sp. SID10853]|nr:iron transporter [Streptomyces sp. SID10853]